MVRVERTFPAPISLEIEKQKKSGSYSEPDVVEQLKKDFHNKCYICELADLQDPQIEHLLPHKNGEYPERKFDWNNLFWACGHCNGVKNQKVMLTAELIQEVFCIKNTGMRVYKSSYRLQMLRMEMNALYDNLEKIKKNPESRVALRKLKALLRRESAFAAFKRCYVREHLEKYPMLAEYLS